MSYSYPRIIIDLVCTDARETNCTSLPFTDTFDGTYLVNPGDADAGYINEQWLNTNLLAAGEESHYDIIEVPSGLCVLNPPLCTY